MRRNTSLAVCWLSLGACAPRPLGNVAPSPQTVVAETEPAFDAQEIYVKNNSSVLVMVTSVWLRDCQNVQEPCTQVPLRIPIAPGDRRRIATVHALNRRRAYSYHYSWTWSTSSGASPQPVQALAQQPTSCFGRLASDTTIYDTTQVTERPKLRQFPQPQYPRDARNEGVQGRVIVEFVLNANGTVDSSSVRVIRGVRSDLDASAISFVRNEAYWPACQDQRPVRIRLVQPVDPIALPGQGFDYRAQHARVRVLCGPLLEDSLVLDPSWPPAGALVSLWFHGLDELPNPQPVGMPIDHRGIQGTVIVVAIIDTTGRVEEGSVKVLSTPDDGFLPAVRRYLAGLRGRPGRVHDRPVRVCMPIEIRFH